MKDDCISRTAAIDMVKRCFQPEHRNKEVALQMCVDGLSGLPSAQTERKAGHWIEKDGFDGDVYYDCSVCGESWTTIEGTPWDNGMNYCPNCGADMRGEECQQQ